MIEHSAWFNPNVIRLQVGEYRKGVAAFTWVS